MRADGTGVRGGDPGVEARRAGAGLRVERLRWPARRPRSIPVPPGGAEAVVLAAAAGSSSPADLERRRGRRGSGRASVTPLARRRAAPT
jgi:hypothetical protein